MGQTVGLNPCSNGMTIEFEVGAAAYEHNKSLNPCSNGMTIEFNVLYRRMYYHDVLILVLME